MFTVGGSITGLNAAGLVLVLAPSGELVFVAPGSTQYSFSTPIGGNYSVGTAGLPPWLDCNVNNTVSVAGPASANGSNVFCSAPGTRGLVVSSSDAGATALYLVDAEGRFKVATLQTANPAGLAASAANFTFLTGTGSASLQTLRLNANLTTTGFSTGAGTGVSIATTREGRSVYIGDSSGFLQMYSINLVSASPTQVSGPGGQQTQMPGVARAIAVDFSDRFVVAALSTGALASYQFTGAPQPLGQVSLVDAGLASPQAMAFAASGRQGWVVNSDDTLSTFFLDRTTGALTTGAAVATGGQGANALAVHPSGRFLFVSHAQSNEVRRYGIGDGGSVAFEAQTPVGQGPVGVLADPSGRLLFVLNHQSQELQSFAIAPDGVLTLVHSVRTEVGATGFSLMRGVPSTFESTTGWLTKPSALGIDTLGVSRDGGLTFRSTVSSFTTPTALGSDSWGRMVHSASSTGFFTGVLRAWTPGTNGALTLSRAADAGGTSLAVDPQARWVFLSNGSFVGRFDTFSLALQSSIASQGPIAMEPLGRALFVTPSSGASVSAFPLRRTTGDALPGSTLFLPASPLTVKADPTGGRVYVLSATTGALWQVNWNVQSNALTLDPNTLTTPAPGRDLAVDPFGRFVWAATVDGSLVAFRRNPDGGTLLPVGVYDAGTPTQLAIDGAGRSLYVVVPSQNAIWGYAVDQLTGALSPMSSSFSTLSTPGLLVLPTQLP